MTLQDFYDGKTGGYSETAAGKPKSKFSLPKLPVKRSKRYRLDLGQWEETVQLGLFKMYVYKVWKGGVMIGFKRLWPVKNARYFQFRELPPLEITQQEVAEKYNGNKYEVPVNLKIIDK